jgi:tRNA pseudouridine55 synthase
MHSAKKVNGQTLYKLARKGEEIERQPKLCHLYEFEISEYQSPLARFRVSCSAGTYIRTLAQDFARINQSVGMLDNLCRTQCGDMSLNKAQTMEELCRLDQKLWPEQKSWVPFDEVLSGFPSVQVSLDEAQHLRQGRQQILINLVGRAQHDEESSGRHLAIYHQKRLAAVALKEHHIWKLERVF